MPLELKMGYDIRARLAECGTPRWAGKGAEALGLTGEATREDVLRVFGGTEDDPPEVKPYEPMFSTPEPEESGSVLGWMKQNKIL